MPCTLFLMLVTSTHHSPCVLLIFSHVNFSCNKFNKITSI